MPLNSNQSPWITESSMECLAFFEFEEVLNMTGNSLPPEKYLI